MKTKLMSILFAGFALSVASQTLITENFDALNAGNMATTNTISYATTTAGQGGWSVISNMAVPSHSYFQVETIQNNDKRLALSGSPTAPGAQSGSNYVQKSINWGTRTTGNDVVYAECLFNTGDASVSKNEFYFAIYNTNRSKCLGGYIYVHDTHVLKGLAYDSTDATANGNYSYPSIGTGGTSLVLNDNTDYYLVVGYDINTGKTNWYVSEYATQNIPLCNGSRQNNVAISDAAILVTAARAGTSNTASSTCYYDNISIQARPCYKYTTLASADFAYTGGMHCLGTANLNPAIMNPTSTGVFSSTPAGLDINATTGLINMSSSQAGTYSVTFITNNPSTCLDTAITSITLTASTTPTFSINDLICTGNIAPTLPSTSTNSISGTWSPATVNNTTTGTYTFTPNPGQCVLPVSKTINVVSTPVTPTFSISNTICTGSAAPILATTSDNAVSGTWTPPTVSNTTTGTYTFTPISGACATTTTTTITVSTSDTPVFTLASSLCSGETAPLLPSTSENAISGTWLPTTVSNTATGTYTFTPVEGSCATPTSTTITITPNVTPSFTLESTICEGDQAPILTTTSNNSITGTWIPSTVSNTNTGTYTFTPNSGICATSTSATVTVLDCSGIEEESISSFTIFPNPASDLISISFAEVTNNNENILLIAADGKIIEQRSHTNATIEQFNVSTLKAGIYFFQIGSTIEKIIIQ